MEELRKLLEEIRKDYPSPTLEQSYLKWKHEDNKATAEKFPILWSYIFKKRYILPQYRQPDYYSQEIGDFMLLDMFWGYIYNKINPEDHVIAHCMSNWIAGFQYDRPTLFLEQELGEPFMKMKLPLEYYAHDIKWKWPAFRVYLPKGLLTVMRNNEPCSAMFLDIGHLSKGQEVLLPSPIALELFKNIGFSNRGRIPMAKAAFDQVAVTFHMNLDSPEGGTGYAANAQLGDNTFLTLIQQVGEDRIKSPIESDATDDDFMNKALKLALNILLYLSSEPMQYDPDIVLRKSQKIGNRLITGLYPARFVGREQCRPGLKSHKATLGSTGITLPPHWRGGHHRWQRYGKGNKELKLIWIDTYHTGTEPDKSEDLTRVKK